MDEYEQLSEEELRRRREIARRRKLAARERRRKKRRQEAIVRCSILLIIVILLIVGIVKGISGIWKHFHKSKENAKTTEQVMQPTTQEPTTEEFVVDESILATELPADRDSALATIKERATAEEDTDLQNICDNAAVYSDRVLMNLAANPELKQYTMDYVTKVSATYEGNFNMDVSTDEVPLLLQYDEQWGYADYGNNLLAYNGTAPTALSMVASYLKKDTSLNPIRIGDAAMASNYVDEDGKTSWDLFTQGVSAYGLSCDEMSVNEGNMKAALDEGKVIICCMQSGDFTKDAQHYIVIRGYDDYKFYVNDPASSARSAIAWPFERLSSQIENMWAFAVDENSVTSGDGAATDITSGTTDDSSSATGTDNSSATSGTDNSSQTSSNSTDTSTGSGTTTGTTTGTAGSTDGTASGTTSGTAN